MTSQYFAADTSSVKPEEAWNDWGDWGDGNINNNNNNNISSNAMSQSHQVQPVQNANFLQQSQVPPSGSIYSPFAYQQPQYTQPMTPPNNYQPTMSAQAPPNSYQPTISAQAPPNNYQPTISAQPPPQVTSSIMSNDSFYPENRERLDDVANHVHAASPGSFTDRHNYLVTGQLPQDRTTWPSPPPPQEELPPSVLSRMVVGQPENNEETVSGIDPLPLGNRMVTGTEMPPTTFISYSRQADGEVSQATSVMRPQPSLPFTHYHHQVVPEVAQPSFNTSDRNLYLVAGESDVNDHRVIPGVESPSSVPVSIMNPMQNLHIQDDDDFVNVLSLVPDRAVDVDGMETVMQEHRPIGSQSREEVIDGANDLNEVPPAPPVDHITLGNMSNDLESDVREEAIEGANDYNDEVQKVEEVPKSKVERKKPDSALSSEDSELRELEHRKLNSKSRRNKKYAAESNESDNEYSDGDKRVKSRRAPREKVSREDYEKSRRREKERRSGDRPRKGEDTDGSKNGEPKRRTDDENEYRRNRDKYKKSSRYDEELDEKEKKRREKYRESGSRKKEYAYDDDRRDRRRRDRYQDDESYSGRRSQNTSDREYASDRYNRRSRDQVEKERKYDPNSYYQQYAGYDQSSYNYNSYYQQQQYYETLRRTNPQAYYEWYTKYIAMMQQQAQARQQQSTTTADDIGGSMRSGYNSSNEKDRLSSSRFLPGGDVTNPLRSMNSSFIDNTDYTSLQGFPSVGKDLSQAYGSLNYGYDRYSRGKNLHSGTETQRLTPKKFQSLHTFVKLSNGIMTTIDSSNNDNGYTVKIGSFPIIDKSKRLYQLYPGPLVRGVSHKKTVIEFCEEKLKQDQHIVSSHRASHALLWSYLILMLRQNGNYNETDISELLMKNAELFKTSIDSSASDEKQVQNEENTDVSDSDEVAVSEKNSNSASQSQEETTNMSSMSSKVVLHKFRDYLLYGNINDALDFATDNNLWGHALFLASKVDRRQHANVMLKFANKLPYNDPLQTLYQIMSGRMPACVTNLDDKWGDWRSHLAMIISNCTDKPELVKRSIIALGDSLSTRGDIFGSQFCYLLVEPSFREYSDVTSESKIAMLGASHQMPFKKFATDDAIIMSEVYEYARSLSEEHFFIPSLQKYKLILAGKILDYGMQLKSLMYMEQIAKCIVSQPSLFDFNFKSRVYSMADRLKFYDPVMEKSYEDNYNNNGSDASEDQKWLQDLAATMQGYDESYDNREQLQSQEQTPEHTANDAYNPLNYQVPATLPVIYNPISQHQTPTHVAAATEEVEESYQPNNEQNSTFMNSNETFNQSHYQADPNYSYEYNNPNVQPQMTSQPPQVFEQSPYDPNLNASYQPVPASTDYGYGWDQNASYQQPQPTITLGNTASNKFDDSAQKSQGTEEAKKTSPKKEESGKEKKGLPQDGTQAGGGWFGGIFSKLSMKPKNQMILPDDKNPTILWDESTKKWVNKDGGESEAEAFKPPPKMGAMMGGMGGSLQPMNQQPMASPIMQQPALPPQPQIQSNQMDQGFIQPQQQQVPQMQPQNFNAAPVHENLAQPPTTNMFKMQKGKNLKKSYVDILGNSGQTVSQPKELASQMDMQFFNPVQQQQQGMQFYNPNDFN